MLIHAYEGIAGLVVTCIALVYFTRLYSATHRFSCVRLCCVLLLTMLLFGPAAVFVAGKVGDENTQRTYNWGGIVVVLLMCGGVGAIFALGLGCSRAKGALSKFASKVLRCQER